MIIQLRDIPPEGKHYVGAEPSSGMDFPETEDLRTKGPVHYDLRAQCVSGQLIVQGALGVDVILQCRRCAELFSPRVVDEEFDCVHEVGSEMPDASPGTEVVDLTEDMREAMVCAFPAYPVCAQECKGLCAQCGANLNIAACSCRRPEDGRWGMLEGLRIDEGDQ